MFLLPERFRFLQRIFSKHRIWLSTTTKSSHNENMFTAEEWRKRYPPPTSRVPKPSESSARMLYSQISEHGDSYSVNTFHFQQTTMTKIQPVSRYLDSTLYMHNLPNLDSRLRHNLRQLHEPRLTPVQRHVYSLFASTVHREQCHFTMMLAGMRDPLLVNDSVLACVLPILGDLAAHFPAKAIQLWSESPEECRQNYPSALVLVPSSYRATWCYKEICRLTCHTPIQVSCELPAQLPSLPSVGHVWPPQVVVGSPSAVLKALESRRLSLEACRHLVLDSLHLMFAANIAAIESILDHATSTPGNAFVSSSSAMVITAHEEETDEHMKRLIQTLVCCRPGAQEKLFLCTVQQEEKAIIPEPVTTVAHTGTEKSQEVVSCVLQPGYMPLAYWFTSRPKARNSLHDVLYPEGHNRDGSQRLELALCTATESETEQTAESDVLLTPGLDYRVRTNLLYRRVRHLTSLERGLFHRLTHVKGAVVLWHDTEDLSPKVEDAITRACLLPLVNNLATNYPQEAMNLLVRDEFLCQYPSIVILLPSIERVRDVAMEVLRLTVNSRVNVATALGPASSKGLRYGYHILVSTPPLLLQEMDSLSLRACRHIFVQCSSHADNVDHGKIVKEIVRHATHGVDSHFLRHAVKYHLLHDENVKDGQLKVWIDCLASEDDLLVEQTWKKLVVNSQPQRSAKETTLATTEWKKETLVPPEWKEEFFVHMADGVKESSCWSSVYLSDLNVATALTQNLLSMGLSKLSPLGHCLWNLQGSSVLSLVLMSGVSRAMLMLHLHEVLLYVLNRCRDATFARWPDTTGFPAPSSLILVSSTIAAHLCLEKINMLTKGTSLKTCVLRDFPSITSTFHIAFGTPNIIWRHVEEGRLSLRSCRHVVALHLIGQEEDMANIANIVRHPSRGLKNVASTLLVSAEIGEGQGMRRLAEEFVPNINGNLVTLAQRLPKAVEYVVERLTCEPLQEEEVCWPKVLHWLHEFRQRHILKEAQRILIVWNGRPRPDLWRQAMGLADGKEYFVEDGVTLADVRRGALLQKAFLKGDLPMLLLAGVVLREYQVVLPSLTAVINVGWPRCSMADFVYLNQQLVSRTETEDCLPLSVLLVTNDDEEKQKALVDLWQSSEIPLPKGLIHTLL